MTSAVTSVFRHRLTVAVIGVLALVGLLVVFFKRPLPEAEVHLEPALSQLDSNVSFKFTPLDEPSAYVGSSSCRTCHEKEHDSWHRSYHRTMTQAASPGSVLADFDYGAMEHMGERFILDRQGDEFWVNIDDPQDPDPAAVSLRLRIGMVTGSHHMQVYWMSTGRGNMQLGFPFTWLIGDQRWVPRNSVFLRDPEIVVDKEIWNTTCIRCHATAPQPRPNREQGIFETRAAELGISCEACHGPAKDHVAHQRELEKNPDLEESNEEDPIVQPGDLDHVRSSHVCASCHSMKWWDENEGWRDHGFRFRPGDDLEATTPVMRPTQIDSQPWLKPALEKDPDIFDNFFWSDGMIRVSGREFNGLLESPCYQRGEMSCLSCHSIHKSDPNDLLGRGMEGNKACVKCHEEIRDNISAHTHHQPDSQGSLCYNCHMPRTTFSLLTAIRSHEIDNPDVSVTQDTGRPNACNLCHQDQTLEWTAEHLTEWYDQSTPEFSEDERSISPVLLDLLKGDAGQRVLAAWNIRWNSAHSVSGDHWQAPVLAELLVDPYSAVRYVAHKSLQQLPGFESFDYDFVGPEGQREQAKDRAKVLWETLRKESGEIPFAKDSVLMDGPGNLQTELIQRLLSERNDRSIRLRE